MWRGLVALAGAVIALAAPAVATAAPIKAGAASVDASWHVGASAGQYASDGTFVSHEEQTFDPTAHSTKRVSSYGIQSRLQVRAIVVEGPDGDRFAIVKNDFYIPQDLVYRRAGQLLRERDQNGDIGIGPENLSMAVTHNHSSPFYSSTSWGVWAFQDVFDVRFYNDYAERMADAVEKAAKSLVPVRVGAAVTQFDKTPRHSFGGEKADDGTPAGYLDSDSDHDMIVVRFDDVSDPGNPKPLANLVNFAVHPEFLDGNNLISADYVGPLEKMADDATGGLTIWTQGAVGTSEPERSTYHSIHERLEFTHREYRQAEYGARLMSNSIVELFEAIGNGSPGASWRQQDKDRFVPFDSDFEANEVGFEDRWFPGPLSHPYPGVSSCKTDEAIGGNPRFPIIGLPDCNNLDQGLENLSDILGGPDPPNVLPLPVDPGLTTDDFQNAGVPVPENYSAPSYTGLQEDINVHLQGARLGDIFLAMCSCELWADQSRNTKTRTDRIPDNEYLGYDWKDGGGAVSDGSHINPTGHPLPPPCTKNGDTWTCPDPDNLSQNLPPLSDQLVEHMHRQVTNSANGWNDPENTAEAESEPTDLDEIKGNFTHDDRCAQAVIPPSTSKPENDHWDKPCGSGEQSPSAELGYKLTVALGMVNDYNGYIASYREYQRGDHYRKALTGWGAHSSDYMSSRLVNIGRVLNGGDAAKLLPAENLQSKVDADVAVNEARAQALGEGGTTATEAYEQGLPNDGGTAGAVQQPGDVERFDGIFFTWIGGSNYTDNPQVKVQRKVAGEWRDYAGQAGEIPATVKYPAGEDVAAHETGSFEWQWTAHFEVFSSAIEIIEGGRTTPVGVYRFVVDGHRREGTPGQVVPYQLESEEFEVKAWSGITVEDVKVDQDGHVSFKLGPRANRTLGPLQAEIGPIDYPDSYDYGPGGPLPKFIAKNIRGVADPAAPGDPELIEWYCDECSFRPWLDFGDADSVKVTFQGAGGAAEQVEATQGVGTADAGRGAKAHLTARWRTVKALGAGQSAVVGPGCVKDGFGNYNGNASAAVGGGAPTGANCPVESPADSANAPAGGGGGAGGGAGGGGGSGGGRGGVGDDIAKVLQGRLGGGCALPTGRVGGRKLGKARLGGRRAGHRKALPGLRKPRRSMDRFCMGKRHLRIGYATRGLLSKLGRSRRDRAARRAVLLLTSHPHYSIQGVKPGSSLRTLKRRLKGLRSFRIGANRWYIARGGKARLVFKVRHGKVREVGLADLRLTRSRLAVPFLRSFQ
jgi:hypothetical protein